MLPFMEDHPGQYSSPLASWETRSAVRSKPRRVVADEPGRRFFSAALTPIAAHPLVTARGEAYVELLLTHRLYAYLDFTTILEQEIVNPVLLRLTRDAYGFELQADMKFDAYRIYCDEAYHALFSEDVKRQVSEASSVSPHTFREPAFATMIRSRRESVPVEVRGLVDLCAVVVSETLISGALAGIPADPTVVAPVRHMFADHAADERTHHAYFTKVLECTWPQLDRRVQQALEPLFADFIVAFLMPDLPTSNDLLTISGLSDHEAWQVVSQTLAGEDCLVEVRRAARSTIRLLERTGILDSTRTRDYFTQRGLLAEMP